jgi:tungstate transport system ATP-binding protein
MSLYALSNIKQIFAGQTVLDLPSLELAAGQSYALLGPNGSGKTTLLHILALLKAPAQGALYFKGNPVIWKEKFLTPLRRQVVLVDQQPIMFSSSVQKNVEYGLKVRKVPKHKRSKIALECLEQVGMQDFAQRHAHLLSGGETQRVAIARALACSPEVMLFDEPTASVDVENQAVIEKIIMQLRSQRDITVIFSTHKRLEAARLAENKIFLFEGKPTGPGGENLLPGVVVQRENKKVCIIQDHVELETHADHEGPCRVLLNPEKVRVYSLEQAQAMSSNHLPAGKVLQMTAEGGQIKVLLDIGFPLRAVISRQEAAASGIMAGDEVRVNFEAGAAQPVLSA